MTNKFHYRKDAGLLLAKKLELYIKNTLGSEGKKESFIVMAIPQGGSLGDIIASELNIELDIIICKKMEQKIILSLQ
jgi:predicted phosphoribosyltransferase